MGARILAIDDTEQNLTLIELYLQDTEFELVTAPTSSAGLDLVRRIDFDLILLDVVMPRMDGFELCARLKADPRTKDIPVIFLTGQIQTESEKLQAYELGAVDYISKPVHGGELIARIRAMLRLREASAILERKNISLVRQLQLTRGELDALRAEVEDLHALIAEKAGASVHVVVDERGRVQRCDARFARLWTEAGEPKPEVVPELAGLRAGEGEVDIACGGGATRRFAFERLSIPLAQPGQALLALFDVSHEAAMREAVASRQAHARPRLVGSRSDDYRISGLIGDSASVLELHGLVDRLRNVRSSVLVCGESGTGKELVARALHFDGKFKSQSFIPIHCGAISPHIIESELFGHEKGAFTGAASASRGLLAAADGGTVFLDEIAETSAELQVKLLRVLQIGEVRPVGSTHSQRIDVRFIAATNADLVERVRAGAFREDMFHRLNVVTVRLPPLRERVADIAAIAEHFLDHYARRQERAAPVRLSRAALRSLEEYPWPGNVRELENVIIAALSLGCGELVQVEDLPAAVRDCSPPRLRPEPEVPLGAGLRERRAAAERRAIEDALAAHRGDKEAAAVALGMSRSTFYRRLRKLDGGGEEC